MASKLQEYRRMSEEAQRQLTGSLERWQSFLATASRLYKYPYHEQVMIHAQRPDATACAEFDVWNNTMRRYVRRGSKGIALIDTSGDRERLRYVFDVSDTGTRPNSRSLNLWELREEHIPAVSSMLEKNYGVPAGESLAVQLEAVASQLAREYWEDNRRDILGILEDSFLEEYDEFNVGVAFRNAAEVSISYSLMLRCGLEPENYFEHEDFMSVFDFNTPETAGALGTAVSGINQQVLREIANRSRKGARHMKMTYRQNGDYLIPDIRLSEQEDTPIGKYGQMRKQYLKEHRPILWNRLVLSEQLYPHLREIDGTAHRRLDELMPQMAKQAGVTEELKRRDPLKWAGMMNTLKAQAEEIILNELVYN